MHCSCCCAPRPLDVLEERLLGARAPPQPPPQDPPQPYPQAPPQALPQAPPYLPARGPSASHPPHALQAPAGQRPMERRSQDNPMLAEIRRASGNLSGFFQEAREKRKQGV